MDWGSAKCTYPINITIYKTISPNVPLRTRKVGAIFKLGARKSMSVNKTDTIFDIKVRTLDYAFCQPPKKSTSKSSTQDKSLHNF